MIVFVFGLSPMKDQQKSSKRKTGWEWAAIGWGGTGRII